MTPDVLNIASDLRLVRLDAPPVEALSWYQDPETLWMVDGKCEPYTPERLTRMYDWLAERGELWFIEVRSEDAGSGWRAVGDVTLCPGDLPIVIGEKSQRGRHVGRRVIEALCERACGLGWRDVLVGEIYDWNVASQRCFSAAGFEPYERTDRGARWRRRL